MAKPAVTSMLSKYEFSSRWGASLLWASGLLFGAGLGVACGQPSSSDCSPGTANCECIAGECYTGLQCVADFCVDLGGGETGDGDGDSGDGDGDGDNPCDGGLAFCGGKCVDTQSNFLHCGGCNIACPAGDSCFEGDCVQSCANAPCEGFTYCDGASELCLPGCEYDEQCGFNEACDYDSHTCVCYDGYQLCAGECIYELDPCADNCGNGVVDPGEVCDGSNLDGYDCIDFGWEGGTLTCSSDCTEFSEATCSNGVCGNGVIEDGEECDGIDLGGETCMTQGFVAGTLTCSGCVFDTSACSNMADSGDCCDVNGSPGCEVPAIEMCVCMLDAFCCDNTWDQTCVNQAVSDCMANCP